jgi:hypothetical protein
LRNGAREAMAEDDGLLLSGLALEGKNDDDTLDDTAALFGIDLGDGPAAPTPIELDGDGGEGASAIVNSNSNSSAPSVADSGNVGKRKSPVCTDFEEIYETMSGVKICTKATCKMCKTTLSARSSADTGVRS